MGGPAGVGGPSTVDWSRQVCEAPPPEEQVCELPPEEQVCEAEPDVSTESHVSVGNHTEHESNPWSVSFPEGHGDNQSHGEGHGESHSTAETVAHYTHIPHRVGQGIEIAEGVAHAQHAHVPGLAPAAKVLAPIAIIGGGAEIIHGVERIQHGDTAEGSLDIAEGTAAVTAGTATLIGGAAATTVAPVAAAAGAGLAIGRAGDSYSKELDIYGNGNSASDELGDVAYAAGSTVAEWTGSETVGDVVGIGTVIVASPVYATHAVGSFIVGGASDAWNYIWD